MHTYCQSKLRPWWAACLSAYGAVSGACCGGRGRYSAFAWCTHDGINKEYGDELASDAQLLKGELCKLLVKWVTLLKMQSATLQANQQATLISYFITIRWSMQFSHSYLSGTKISNTVTATGKCTQTATKNTRSLININSLELKWV